MEKIEIGWKYPEAIISCKWLQKNFGNKNLRIYDCTTFLHYTDDHPSKPYDVESGHQDYLREHIPGASFLDLQIQISDPESQYKFTLPDIESLSKSYGNLGIGDPYHIILYSTNGLQWSTRVWWMIYMLGYKNVSVLNGGLRKWLKEKKKVTDEISNIDKSNYKGSERKDLVKSKQEIDQNIDEKIFTLIDARSRERFEGKIPEPRKGLRSGCIKNSFCIPFNDCLNEDKTFKNKDELKKIFKTSIENLEQKKIVFSCGSGVTACVLALAYSLINDKYLPCIYDGSWAEYGLI